MIFLISAQGHSIVMSLFLFVGLIWLAQSAAGFSWQICGSKDDPIRIQSLTVSQNSSMLVQIKGQGSVANNISSPVLGTLVLMKKMFWGWTTIPCIDGVGSCTYKDVCVLSPYKDSCPDDMRNQGLPCKCPIAEGTYGGKLVINLKKAGMPNWLESGLYRVRATLEDAKNRLLCIQFEIKLK